MILLNRGWGKTGPAHSFPPQKSSYLSIYLFSLLDYATLWMYLNNFELPIPKWELSFLTYNFIGTSTLSDGERLGRPILPPPSIMFGSFNLFFSLSVYVTFWLYLNNFEWPIPKRDQVFKPTSYLVRLHCGVGKNLAGPFVPTPKCWDLSIYSLDFWIMLFFCCIVTLLTYTKQRIKFSNQQVYL